MRASTKQTRSTARGWRPSETLAQLKEDHEHAVAAVGAERAIHYTEFFKRYADEYASVDLRMAHALRYHLEHRTIRINDGELIVGSHTEHRIGAICQPELSGNYMLEDIFKFKTRPANRLGLGKKAKSRLLWECMPYWLTRNLVMKAFPFIEKIKYSIDQLNAKDFIINEAGGIAHFLPDYPSIIAKGTEGLRQDILNRRKKSDRMTQKSTDFLNATIVVLDALDHFADRYRELAVVQGRSDIADVLALSPRKPARTLREAIQTIWFFQLVIQIESLDQGISLGRIDQYLHPLYLRECKAGTFSNEAFRDLLCAFSLKLSEVIPLLSSRLTEYHGGLPSGQAVTIGGINAQGQCAANELTYAMLDVIDKWKVRQPNWHARISKRSDPAYVKAVMRVVAAGGGSPALYNDEVIMEALRIRGFPKERLYDYATIGCVEPGIPGESFTSSDAAIVNLPSALERVFQSRKALSRAATTDDLLAEFESELRRTVETLHRSLSAIERAHAKFHPTPFSSVTVKGCIESATDLTAGGARENASGIQGVGLADVADSIHAADVLVFQQGALSLDDLAKAMKSDFAQGPNGKLSGEALRLRLSNLSGYGNDRQRPDELAGRIAEIFDRAVSDRKNTRGGRWMPGLYSMTCHRAFGTRTGALPSGRRKGAAFADGIACVDGQDGAGPTAFFNSVARIDNSRFGNGVNLNAKFDARFLRGETGANTLSSLVLAYFGRGGMQVQVNIIDPEILVAAMKNPDKYRNLLVRVSGYCAYFADLTMEMQREIIERTTHSVR